MEEMDPAEPRSRVREIPRMTARLHSLIDRTPRSKLPRLCNPSNTVTVIDEFLFRRKIEGRPSREALDYSSYEIPYFIEILQHLKGGEEHKEVVQADTERT